MAPPTPTRTTGAPGAASAAAFDHHRRQSSVTRSDSRTSMRSPSSSSTARYPPSAMGSALRVATVRARREHLEHALSAIDELGGSVDVLGPVPEDGGLERAILRADYGAATRLAEILKAEQIRVATERRRPVAGQPVRKAPTLRVRFDDPEVS